MRTPNGPGRTIRLVLQGLAAMALLIAFVLLMQTSWTAAKSAWRVMPASTAPLVELPEPPREAGPEADATSNRI